VSGIVVDLSDLLVEAAALVAELAREGAPGSRAATLERLPAMLQSVARAESRLAHARLDEAARHDAASSPSSVDPTDSDSDAS
jgi:enoyl-CoA hydratase/carnithine racemase